MSSDIPLGINVSTGQKYDIIIAEDSKPDRELLKRFLIGMQFNLLIDVQNGKNVVEFLNYSGKKADLIFLDHHMEPKNSVETVREIKPLNPNAKIIIITASTDKKVLEELLALKIDAYILKPISRAILDDKLTQILNRKDRVLTSKVKSPAPQKTFKLEELSIPPLPNVSMKIIAFESDPVKGSLELEQIMSPDKAICADILRVANSAFYGRQKKVQTLKEAITLLGLKTIKYIVMIQSQKKFLRNLMYHDLFKKYLLELPILTSLVAIDLTAPLGKKALREEVLLPAMMQKIGMNILALNYPTIYKEILEKFQGSSEILLKMERDQLGLSQIEVGLFVFNLWKLPPQLSIAMNNQNFVGEEMDKVEDLDRILRLANILSRKMLKLPVHASEDDLAGIIIKHYKVKEDLLGLFGEDYYSDIKEHPFFEAI